MNNRTATLTSSAILAILVLSPIGAYAISNPVGSSTSAPPRQAPAVPPAPNALGENDIFYGNTASLSCPTTMYSYDPSTDSHTAYSLTSTTGEFCNGRAMAWDGTNLWYTVVSNGGTCQAFEGDGLIHEVAPTGGADIATIKDPYGMCANGIGAMKFDSAGGHLWIESYLPFLGGVAIDGSHCSPSTACLVEVSELDVSTDTVLASCTLPFRGGGAGSDTFSLFTGNEFATDGGEILTSLYFYQEPTTVGGSCVQVGSPVPIQGATGLNFASNGDCIYTDAAGNTYNGGSNCDTVLTSTTNGFPVDEEDITCTTLPTTGSLCALPPPIVVGAPEFGGSASTILVAAVAMVGVAFLARRKSIAPIARRT